MSCWLYTDFDLDEHYVHVYDDVADVWTDGWIFTNELAVDYLINRIYLSTTKPRDSWSVPVSNPKVLLPMEYIE